jgi:hypothetical protein
VAVAAMGPALVPKYNLALTRVEGSIRGDFAVSSFEGTCSAIDEDAFGVSCREQPGDGSSGQGNWVFRSPGAFDCPVLGAPIFGPTFLLHFTAPYCTLLLFAALSSLLAHCYRTTLAK